MLKIVGVGFKWIFIRLGVLYGRLITNITFIWTLSPPVAPQLRYISCTRQPRFDIAFGSDLQSVDPTHYQ